MTTILDGKPIAAQMEKSLSKTITGLHIRPSLTIIMVGDNPASEIYVRRKLRVAMQLGIDAEAIHLPSSIEENDLLTVIHKTNESSHDGFIVQLPLPPHIRQDHVFEALDPMKDVDGFHPMNVGRLASGGRRNVPCTARAIMTLLEASQKPVRGANALVIGCSPIVGRPTCTLLTQAHATVTNAHIHTRHLADETKRADIIVVAAGCPNLIRGDMIKPGAVIIDVGINRLADGQIVGDVAFAECLGIADVMTPVPGGVGPLTVACLMQNTIEAAMYRAALS